jgi:hypothetical protein
MIRDHIQNAIAIDVGYGPTCPSSLEGDWRRGTHERLGPRATV